VKYHTVIMEAANRIKTECLYQPVLQKLSHAASVMTKLLYVRSSNKN